MAINELKRDFHDRFIASEMEKLRQGVDKVGDKGKKKLENDKFNQDGDNMKQESDITNQGMDKTKQGSVIARPKHPNPAIDVNSASNIKKYKAKCLQVRLYNLGNQETQ